MIHQIRSYIKYVSYKDVKEFVTDLKPIYKAPTVDITLQSAHHSAGHEILFRSKRAHRNDGEPIH